MKRRKRFNPGEIPIMAGLGGTALGVVFAFAATGGSLALAQESGASQDSKTAPTVLYLNAPGVSTPQAREAGAVAGDLAQDADTATQVALYYATGAGDPPSTRERAVLADAAEEGQIQRALASITDSPDDPGAGVTASAAEEAGHVLLAQMGAEDPNSGENGSGEELAATGEDPVRPELADDAAGPEDSGGGEGNGETGSEDAAQPPIPGQPMPVPSGPQQPAEEPSGGGYAYLGGPPQSVPNDDGSNTLPAPEHVSNAPEAYQLQSGPSGTTVPEPPERIADEPEGEEPSGNPDTEAVALTDGPAFTDGGDGGDEESGGDTPEQSSDSYTPAGDGENPKSESASDPRSSAGGEQPEIQLAASPPDEDRANQPQPAPDSEEAPDEPQGGDEDTGSGDELAFTTSPVPDDAGEPSSGAPHGGEEKPQTTAPDTDTGDDPESETGGLVDTEQAGDVPNDGELASTEPLGPVEDNSSTGGGEESGESSEGGAEQSSQPAPEPQAVILLGGSEESAADQPDPAEGGSWTGPQDEPQDEPQAEEEDHATGDTRESGAPLGDSGIGNGGAGEEIAWGEDESGSQPEPESEPEPYALQETQEQAQPPEQGHEASPEPHEPDSWIVAPPPSEEPAREPGAETAPGGEHPDEVAPQEQSSHEQVPSDGTQEEDRASGNEAPRVATPEANGESGSSTPEPGATRDAEEPAEVPDGDPKQVRIVIGGPETPDVPEQTGRDAHTPATPQQQAEPDTSPTPPAPEQDPDKQPPPAPEGSGPEPTDKEPADKTVAPVSSPGTREEEPGSQTPEGPPVDTGRQAYPGGEGEAQAPNGDDWPTPDSSQSPDGLEPSPMGSPGGGTAPSSERPVQGTNRQESGQSPAEAGSGSPEPAIPGTRSGENPGENPWIEQNNIQSSIQSNVEQIGQVRDQADTSGAMDGVPRVNSEPAPGQSARNVTIIQRANRETSWQPPDGPGDAATGPASPHSADAQRLVDAPAQVSQRIDKAWSTVPEARQPDTGWTQPDAAQGSSPEVPFSERPFADGPEASSPTASWQPSWRKPAIQRTRWSATKLKVGRRQEGAELEGGRDRAIVQQTAQHAQREALQDTAPVPESSWTQPAKGSAQRSGLAQQTEPVAQAQPVAQPPQEPQPSLQQQPQPGAEPLLQTASTPEPVQTQPDLAPQSEPDPVLQPKPDWQVQQPQHPSAQPEPAGLVPRKQASPSTTTQTVPDPLNTKPTPQPEAVRQVSGQRLAPPEQVPTQRLSPPQQVPSQTTPSQQQEVPEQTAPEQEPLPPADNRSSDSSAQITQTVNQAVQGAVEDLEP